MICQVLVRHLKSRLPRNDERKRTPMDSYIYLRQFRGLCFFEQLLSSQGKSCQVRDRTGVASIVVFSNQSVTYVQFQGS